MLKRCFVSLILLTLSFVSFSQQQWPATFLWKISGHGLSKPSYLYGTIHLQDKRLFHFPDSLYHYIEAADGFALEIDFSEFVDSMFSQGLREAEDRLYSSAMYSVDRKKLDKSTDTLLDKFGVKADNISKKDLKRIRDYRINKMVQKGEMPTIVDGFLYGIAQRQGKKITGIEDVADQMGLLDEWGADLTPDMVFQPESKMVHSLQQMINVYARRDLQQVMEYFDMTNQQFRDELLIRRNLKMARRMDSLSSIRSTFFAVGVAHLPGDSGVISLLRNKGFIVEPVFSKNYPDGIAYLNRLEKLPWKSVEEKSYQVEMPGQPSNYQLMGNILDMRAFFDLPTMTFYMTGATIGHIEDGDALTKAFSNMATRMNGRETTVKPKKITVNGMSGGEAEIEIPASVYRIRLLQKNNSVYMVMAGSSKKTSLHSAEIDKFFASFKSRDVPADENKLVRFSIPGKAFSINLPGTPRPNTSIDRAAEGSPFNFTSFDYIDQSGGVYYLVQVRDAKEGFFIEGDTTYYAAIKEEYKSRFDKILSDTFFYYKGWPAFKIRTYLKSADATYNIFTLLRGNRVYCVLVGWSKQPGTVEAEEIFNSVVLGEYENVPYNLHEANGFQSSAPAPFISMKTDSTDGNNDTREHFVSYDNNRAVSFEVLRQPLPKFYWTKNDSAYFESVIENSNNENDSIISKSISWNGGLKGRDLLVQKSGSNSVKKMRIFLNGDTLYSIFAIVPRQLADEKEFLGFFDGFRMKKEQQPSIYQNKSEALFEAFKKSDSAEHAQLLQTFNTVTFEKSDLPVLHKALIQTYPTFDDEFSTVNYRVSEAIEGLSDSSTVRFIADNYRSFKDDKHAIKYAMLYLLAAVQTKESYSLLKDFIVSDLPSSGLDYRLFQILKDSFALTRTLFPDILKQSKDTGFVEVIVNLAIPLLDSNLLSIHDLLPYQQQLLAEAKRRLYVTWEDPDAWKLDEDWTDLLGRFNSPESNDFLNELLKVEDNDLKMGAVLSLIKNKRPVTPAVLEKLAADNHYRQPLYTKLEKLGKQQLFPAKYATRQKIAESEIFIYSIDEDEDEDEGAMVKFIGERTTEFLGKKQKFLLYKLEYKYEENSSVYLGVVGPYSLAGTEMLTGSKGSGIYWVEEFDKARVDEQFKAYLKSVEVYEQERESGQIVK